MRTGIEAPIQPCARDLPVAFNRRARGALDIRDVFEREAAEEAQLHDPALSGIERRELGECGVEIEEVDVWWVVSRDGFVEHDAGKSARSLGHLAAPGMLHQDAAHHLGSQSEEVRSILPVGVALADQPKIRLVDQGSGLKDVPGTLAPKPSRRPAAKLLVHYRDELVPRGEIASAPCVEQSGHVVVGTGQLVLSVAPS